MKITSQLLSTSSSVSSKISSSSDNGAEFHSALTAATAKGTSSATSQTKAKTQPQDVKPQVSDKKKSVASDSSVPDSTGTIGPAPKQILQEAATQFVLPLSSTNEGALQTFSQTSGFSTGIEVSGGTYPVSSSLAPISPVVQLPANVLSIGEADRKASDLKLETAAPSDKASELPVGSATEATITNSNATARNLATTPTASVAALPAATTPARSSPIAAASIKASAPLEPVATPPALPTAVVAAAGDRPTPVAESVSTKLVSTDRAAEAAKAADAPSSTPAIDPAVLATQQTAAAIAQSVAGSVSLPNLASIGEFQSTSAIATSNVSNVDKVADTVAGSASRQTVSPAKGKQISAPSDFHSKVTDGNDSETQAASSSTAASPLAAKASEVPGTTGQSSNQPGAAPGSATLQQITLPSQPDGANHLQQATQAVSVSAAPIVHNTPGQAPLEDQSTQGVSSAQLIQSMRSSEMKLGMQSAEFGNISISTSLNHQAISAQISIDHAELGRALAVHLPAIEEKLGSAYGVQAKVELRDTNNPSSPNDSGYSNSGQQSREQRQSQGGGSTATQGPMLERIAARTHFTTSSAVASASRLDIRI